MTKDKIFAFRQRWRELERRRKDLDFDKGVFARELRDEFVPGDDGDAKFIAWCDFELGLGKMHAHELLDRARAAKAVPDEKTFKTIGGFNSIRRALDLPKHERVIAIEAAKAQSKKLSTVLRERNLAGETPRRPAAVEPHIQELRLLSSYLAATGLTLPPEVRRVVERYAMPRLKAVA